jgi:hypothetical protein
MVAKKVVCLVESWGKSWVEQLVESMAVELVVLWVVRLVDC